MKASRFFARTIFITLGCLIGCFIAPQAGARASDRPSCSDELTGQACHRIAQEDLLRILKKMEAPSGQVLSIRNAPIQGLCEVVAQDGTETGVFYVDYDMQYLIVGSIVNLEGMRDLTKESRQAVLDRQRVDWSKIPTDEALIIGDAHAPKQAIVFTRPDCPYCILFQQTLIGIVSKRRDIAFIIKNISLAKSLGISSTPATIMPDGRIRIGALPENELIDLFEAYK